MTSAESTALSSRVDAVRAAGAALFLTVEPTSLAAVTPAEADALAATLASYNGRGVDVLLRFAHEMNGSWYPWGQQPAAYVAAFRTVAAAVHAKAPRTALVWSPNYGGGYPFSGGAYSAPSGSAAFSALDTDHDGVLTMRDDPYAPYYPGDDAVDWVGLTLYHFGDAWPWGENEVPEPGKFVQQVHGTYDGNGRYEDQSAVPDFYGDFAVGHGKPMAIAETGALYNESPTTPGASAYDIKSAWIGQVYSPATRAQLPLLKLVNWFEIRKYESEAKGYVDWRATADPAVLSALQAQVGSGSYVFAGGTTSPTPTVSPSPSPTTTASPSPTPTASPSPSRAATTPSAPTALSGSTSTARLTVSWRAPATDGGAAVSGYSVCLSTGLCNAVSATTTTGAFDGLSRRTAYTVTVRARNGAGTGPAASVDLRTK
jgi:hypothetical protein